MSWFGGGDHLGVLYALGILGLSTALRRWIDGPHLVSHRKLRALAARTVLVAGNRERSHRTVLCAPATSPNLKVRATGHLQGDVPTAAQGSDAPSSAEPTPAPPSPLEGAGTNLQPGPSRLDQGRRRDHSSEQPHPAPGTTSPGAGPNSRAASNALAAGSTEPVPASGTLAGIPGAGPTTRVTTAPNRTGADADPDRDADTSSRTAVSASPQRPAAAVNPDSAAADLPPGAVRGAGPSCVAADGPVRGAA